VGERRRPFLPDGTWQTVPFEHQISPNDIFVYYHLTKKVGIRILTIEEMLQEIFISLVYGFLAGGLVMYFMTHSDFIQNHASTPLHGPIFHINRLKKFTIYQGDYCVEDANSDEESDDEGQSEPEEHEEYSEDEGQSEHSEDEGQSDPEEHEEHSEDEGQSESEEENPNELPKENDSDAELVNFDSKMEGS